MEPRPMYCQIWTPRPIYYYTKTQPNSARISKSTTPVCWCCLLPSPSLPLTPSFLTLSPYFTSSPPLSPLSSLLPIPFPPPPSSYPVSLHQRNPCTMITITPQKVAGEGGRKEQSAPLHGNQNLVSHIDNLTHLSP